VSNERSQTPLVFLVICLIVAIIVGYDAYARHLAKSTAVARRDDRLHAMTAALDQGALDAFIDASDGFLSSSDPWKGIDGIGRGDPRNPSVEAARETAVDLLISRAALDGNVEAVSAAIDRKR
jgi:hypothetical protein